ncbi:lipase [Elysia marginata]|uniref:Lipase n=1 Tax=Elysia marginata TaxID=1093978 RepID=A0AAV4HR63_9GAST|nr:lipase [Elysia marginata]
MAKVILLCLILQVACVSAQFGWLMDILGLSKPTVKPKVITKQDEMRMEAPELITSKGYPCERHWVTTRDGYILELQRIPHGRHSNTTSDQRPVALLQHGTASSSKAWLLNSADKSLPFVLADAGVDVWLGNNRGNIYSKNHTFLSPSQYDEYGFWDFSWDEMAEYDLPAEINYILDITNNKQLYYVGHSQGSTIGFAKFSEHPYFCRKIKHFIALAPVAHVGHVTSGLRQLVPYTKQTKIFLDMFKGGEVESGSQMSKMMSNLLYNELSEDLSMQGLSFLMGKTNSRSIDKSRIDVYNAQLPSSTSAKLLLHWVQAVKTNQFQHFDYGTSDNQLEYNQPTPPLYYPSNITVPVAIFTGGKDALADPTDVSWLLTQINVTHHIDIPWYNHLSLILGSDVEYVIYPHLVPIITGQPWSPNPNHDKPGKGQGIDSQPQNSLKAPPRKHRTHRLRPPPVNRAPISALPKVLIF